MDNADKKIDKDNIQKLKSMVKIEEIMAKEIPMKKHGNNYFCACPLCEGHHSLSININKQFAHCFACNESFDVYGYFQKVKGLSFKEAYREIQKYINSQNSLELRKLVKTSIYLINIEQGINPITEQPLPQDSPFLTDKNKSAISEFSKIIDKLIADYSSMELNEEIPTKKLEEYYSVFNNLSKLPQSEFSLEIIVQAKLHNLMLYLIEICDRIKHNHNNIGGIVYS